MYFCKVILFAILIYFTQKVLGNFENDLIYIYKCNKTSPISLRTMNEVLINQKLSESSNSVNFKCFLHCLFNQYGWMDSEGGFELYEMKKILEESGSMQEPALEYIMYTCTAIKSVDKCERAFIFTECFWKKSNEQTVQETEDKFLYSLDENFKK